MTHHPYTHTCTHTQTRALANLPSHSCSVSPFTKERKKNEYEKEKKKIKLSPVARQSVGARALARTVEVMVQHKQAHDGHAERVGVRCELRVGDHRETGKKRKRKEKRKEKKT
jgi:hypothetical protein